MSLSSLLGSAYGECDESLPASLLPSLSNEINEFPTQTKLAEESTTPTTTKAEESFASSSADLPNTPTPIMSEGNKQEVELLGEESRRLIALANQWMEEETQTPPDEALTAKLQKFHKLRQQNKTFNGNLFNSKSFANPNILSKLVSYFQLDETGTNCPPSVFSLSQFEGEDFYDSIAQRQAQIEQMRVQEQQNRAEIQFVASRGGNSRRVPVTRIVNR